MHSNERAQFIYFDCLAIKFVERECESIIGGRSFVNEFIDMLIRVHLLKCTSLSSAISFIWYLFIHLLHTNDF